MQSILEELIPKLKKHLGYKFDEATQVNEIDPEEEMPEVAEEFN